MHTDLYVMINFPSIWSLYLYFCATLLANFEPLDPSGDFAFRGFWPLRLQDTAQNCGFHHYHRKSKICTSKRGFIC